LSKLDFHRQIKEQKVLSSYWKVVLLHADYYQSDQPKVVTMWHLAVLQSDFWAIN